MTVLTPAAVSAPPHPHRIRNSVLWALVIPFVITLGAWLGQYSTIGLGAGVVLTLGAIATAATLLGGLWHRAWAALLVSRRADPARRRRVVP